MVKSNIKKSRIYLDYAASTPVNPGVLRAMEPYFSKQFGNPGSLHSFGQTAMAGVDMSRETIAKAIGAGFREIVFTASATEANNLAMQGIIQGLIREDARHGKLQASAVRRKIIVSCIEHESILEIVRNFSADNIEVCYLPIGRDGIVDMKKLKELMDERTILVSVMQANNEIGVVQPISEIAKVIHDFRTTRSREQGMDRLPFFHTDAAQGFQFLDCDVNELGVDLMTISSHKIYGPKGAGALYVRRGIENKIKNNSSRILEPLFFGGGQEFGFRSGTENVPAVIGFAKAVELIVESRAKEGARINALRKKLWAGLKKIDKKIQLNVPIGEFQLPNILNVYFPGRSAEDLLTKFDLNGIAASSGSACRSRALESSYVIEALGYSRERARSSIRFSLGRPTQKSEIDNTIDRLADMGIK